jgi:hypothetical protein
MKQVVLKITKIKSHDDNGGWNTQTNEIGDLIIIKTKDPLISIGDILDESIWIETQGVYGYGITEVEGEVVFILKNNKKQKIMNFINLTPHDIVLNNGTIFKPSGIIARVSQTFTKPDSLGICTTRFGEIVDLPERVENTMYIVSGLVLSAAERIGRSDCVAPASGHPETKRNEKGHIISVPYLMQ